MYICDYTNSFKIYIYMNRSRIFGKSVRSNKDFPRVSSFVGRIVPMNSNILVEVLPLTIVPTSKLIIPESESSKGFNHARGIVISKGSSCVNNDLRVGDEVYFGVNLSVTINYPNPDSNDIHYVTLSEQNVVYSIVPEGSKIVESGNNI